MHLGRAYERVGYLEKAVGWYLVAIKLRPGMVELYFAVARLYEKLGLKAEALEIRRRVEKR